MVDTTAPLADARAACDAMSILHCPSKLISVENAPLVFQVEKTNTPEGKFRVDAEYDKDQVTVSSWM